MTWIKRLLVMVFMQVLLAGCGDPIGAACHFKGSGFTASDNCRHRCMQFRDIVCPDVSAIKPKICSGKAQCTPGACPSDQVCYHVNDPFEKDSYCLPADICGTQSAYGLAAWEQASLATSEKTRAAWEAKKQLRAKLKLTAPAEDLPSGPAPLNR